MSTSTPTIYNGRAYIGVSGTGQFTQYSGHNITVIDIPNWEIAYKVRTQGYPQTSGVLTTAYKADEGAVYVYFFDNYTPGKLRVLKDAPGKVSTDLTSTEYSFETALNLFEPRGDQAQYAIATVKLIIKSDIMCGDVDGDGKITVTDAMYIFQYLGQRRELDNDALKAADTDKDGKITVTDAMYIFQYLGQRRELN